MNERGTQLQETANAQIDELIAVFSARERGGLAPPLPRSRRARRRHRRRMRHAHGRQLPPDRRIPKRPGRQQPPPHRPIPSRSWPRRAPGRLCRREHRSSSSIPARPTIKRAGGPQRDRATRVASASMLRVTAVTPLDPYRLRVELNDGVVRDVDCAFLLHGTLGEPLRDPDYFRQVRVAGVADDRAAEWAGPSARTAARRLRAGERDRWRLSARRRVASIWRDSFRCVSAPPVRELSQARTERRWQTRTQCPR